MKNAIAVGIGGLLLSVAWFFYGPAVLEQESPDSMEVARGDGGAARAKQAGDRYIGHQPDAAMTLFTAVEEPSETAMTPSTAAQVPSATESTPALLGLLSNGLIAEEVYSKTCALCHTAGLAAAPKFGIKKDWADRIAKGLDTLYRSSIEGVPPAMPAKGMCFDCSDDDLKAVVDYMVSHSR